MPSGTALGDYFIIVKADCYNWREELVEKNNTTATRITVGGNLPDYTIENVDPSPATGAPPYAAPGQWMSVSYELVAAPYIGPNPGPTTTRYRILIVADSSNDVVESDETNNVGIGHVFVIQNFTEELTDREDSTLEELPNTLSETTLKVFPNPTRDQFNVAYSVQDTPIGISLFNSAGQMISSYSLAAAEQNGQWQYDGDHLPTGIYFIQWQTRDKVELLKVIVE